MIALLVGAMHFSLLFITKHMIEAELASILLFVINNIERTALHEPIKFMTYALKTVAKAAAQQVS